MIGCSATASVQLGRRRRHVGALVAIGSHDGFIVTDKTLAAWVGRMAPRAK
jgi:hypothetical protein